MTGEKLGEHQSLKVASHSWTWHFSSVPHRVGLFHSPVSSPWSRQTIHIWGNATDPSHQCRYMFKRGHSESVNRVPSTTIHHPSSIFMIASLIHISQFVSTSTKSLAPFRVIDVGFIKALLWRIASCRHQLIIQEVDLGTPPSVLWSLHASMASFSLPATGIHQWPSTRRFCVVFDAKSFIHTTWIVLQYLEGHYHYRWFLSRLLTVYIIDR